MSKTSKTSSNRITIEESDINSIMILESHMDSKVNTNSKKIEI